MSKTVFILGAGASLHTGAPLMKEFINAAQVLERSVQPFLSDKEKEHFKLVFKARTQLQSTHSKANIDLYNIESLFGAFEMARLLGKLGSLNKNEVERLPDAMVTVIAKTIEHRIDFPLENYARRLPTQAYGFIADQINRLHTQENGSVSIITFNYDVALDFALFLRQIPFSYCLNKEDSGANYVDVLKLHGSLNWSGCEKCEQVIPYQIKDYHMDNQIDSFQGLKSIQVEMSKYLSLKNNHCNLPVGGQPLIVPPTWNKGRFKAELQYVWRRAAFHLSQAENLVIIGYSLPLTDEFFKYFYALGSVGESVLNNVWLVDPDSQVKERFRRILGATAIDRLQPIGDGNFGSGDTQLKLKNELQKII